MGHFGGIYRSITEHVDVAPVAWSTCRQTGTGVELRVQNRELVVSRCFGFARLAEVLVVESVWSVTWLTWREISGPSAQILECHDRLVGAANGRRLESDRRGRDVGDGRDRDHDEHRHRK